jgi:hypothetical protein
LPSHPYDQVASALQKYWVPWSTEYVLTIILGDGSGGKRTHKMGLQVLYRNLEMEEWYHPSVYQMVYKRMRQYFSEDELFISQRGFET